MKLTKKCPFTGDLNTLHINATAKQYYDYRSGSPIEWAMPTLTEAQKEFVVKGIHPNTWSK